jgi:hypothetical protein
MVCQHEDSGFKNETERRKFFEVHDRIGENRAKLERKILLRPLISG